MATSKLDSKLTFGKVLRLLLKGWIILTSLIGSVFIIFFILVLLVIKSSPEQATSEKTLSGSGSNKIAVINVEGTINDADLPFDPFSPSATTVTPSKIHEQLDQAKNDSAVKAVILKINSPGGSAVASDEIYQDIVRFKNETHKKVLVSMGDMAASGGYYIASSADKIVANQSTITGSIGVLASLYNLKGLYDKLGVQNEVYKTGPYKDLFSEGRDRTPEEKAIIQSLLDDSISQFVARVATGRGMSIDKVKSLADGRIFSGKQAKDNGLVDELGNLSKAVEMAKSLSNIKEATVVEYTSSSFLSSILGSNLRGFGLNLNLKQPSGFSLQYLLSL